MRKENNVHVYVMKGLCVFNYVYQTLSKRYSANERLHRSCYRCY